MWVKEMLGLKVEVADGLGPLAGSSFSNLHKSVLAVSTTGVGIKTAFAPDNGLDKGRGDLVSVGSKLDFGVKGTLTPLGAPPEVCASVEHGKRKKDPQPAAFHDVVLGVDSPDGECGLLLIIYTRLTRARGRTLPVWSRV